MTSTIVIRTARHEDAESLRRLAILDSARPLRGDALVAALDDRPVAALSLADGRVVADPFERTADVVKLLQLRAQRLDAPVTGRHRRDAGLRARLGLAA